MRTNFDHLPAARQRELDRVVQILFEEFRDAHGEPNGQRKLGRILKIILYGSYARGNWVDEPYTAKGYAQEYDIEVGQFVLLCVSDTGTGMTSEIMAKAFDPFFTTKGVGKGTGLGLSQVFGFVRQSGGHIKAYSEVGHGTTFKIYLPRSYSDEPAAVRRRGQQQIVGGQATEIIMVVEDEDRVRDFSVEALRELGYTVVHARSGPEALAMIEAGQAVTLLFTDIVMPEMTGRQLAGRVAKILPEVKVVYTTGYTRNAVVHNGVLDPGTHFLPKPYAFDQLANAVRGALDEQKD